MEKIECKIVNDHLCVMWCMNIIVFTPQKLFILLFFFNMKNKKRQSIYGFKADDECTVELLEYISQ